MKQFILYRHFDKDGSLLYVGMTSTPGRRLAAHAYTSRWAELVDRVTLERFGTHQELREAELRAIAAEDPIYNKVGRSSTTRKSLTVMVSARLPFALIIALDREALKEGSNRSAVMAKFLDAALRAKGL